MHDIKLEDIKFMGFQKYDNEDRGILTIYWHGKEGTTQAKSMYECNYNIFEELKRKLEERQNV